MEKINYQITLGFMGFLSGVLSVIFSEPSNNLLIIFTYYAKGIMLFLPGMFFGLTTGFYILRHFQVPKKNLFFWVVISTLAYLVAFIITLFGMGLSNLWASFQGDNLSVQLISFFIAGSMGALILVSGFNSFFFKITKRQRFFIVSLGGFLGLIGIVGILLQEISIVAKVFLINTLGGFYPLFIIWQTGIAFALGHIIDKDTN